MTPNKLISSLYQISSTGVFILLLIACKDGPNPPTNTANIGSTQETPSPSPKPVELPEPSLGIPGTQGSQTTSRFKLTELSAVSNPSINIKEDIIFSGIQNKFQVPFDEISLKVKSHCIFNTVEGKEQVLIRNYERKLTPSIPIIEILPAKVLLHKGIGYPACGFSFKAENKAGSAHHFEWPQLPIVDYKDGRSFSVIHDKSVLPSLERSKEPFLHVFAEHITDYTLNTGSENRIQNLQLICDDFSLSLSLNQQQFIPFIAFPFDSVSQETMEDIHNFNPYQDCRLFGYSNKTLVGVSTSFKLVYSALRPVEIIKRNNPDFEFDGDVFYAQLLNSNKGLKKSLNGLQLYSMEIFNHNQYPVYIFIKAQKAKQAKVQSYSFYQLGTRDRPGNPIFDKYSHYTDDVVSVSLDTPKIKKGEVVIKETQNGTLITMQAHAWIQLSVVLYEVPDICYVTKKAEDYHFIKWLGTLFKYPAFDIVQLVSDQLPPTSNQNIVQKLDTTNFEEPHLSIFSRKFLNPSAGVNQMASLDFLRGNICLEPPKAFGTQSVLNVYRKPGNRPGHWLTKFENMYVSEEDYKEMNEKVRSAFGRRIYRGI